MSDPGGWSTTVDRGLRHSPRAVPVFVAVFVVALGNRLLPVLRGGGLSGVIGYDDAVYYAGAVGLVHGRLPYQDFLFLHPPGVLLALSPVATLGRITGETAGWELSRLVWMIMGSLTAVIIVGALLPLGRLAAVVGGGTYAVSPPAVLVERTTLVEGLTNLCLAVALALIIDELRKPRRQPDRRATMIMVGAGALLGFATTVKIWGVIPVVAVAIGVVLARGSRAGLAMVTAAAAATVVVCLPFFLAAPTQMWQMVVLDQLGRDHDTALLRRAAQVATMGRVVDGGLALTAALVAAGICAVASIVVWRVPGYRLLVPLTLALVGMLLVAPIFYPHYVAVLAVPVALSLGVITSVVASWRRGWRTMIIAVGVAALLLDATALALVRSGDPVPGELRPAVQTGTGCLTSDDPNNLLALGVVGRNLDRDCPLIVDLGGYSHHLSRGRPMPRSRNPAWQRLVVDYLGSGELALATRFGRGSGYSKATADKIESWPVLLAVDAYELREPPR